MNDRRQTLIDVFQDTKRYYTENQALADAVEHSKARTAFYKANNYPSLPKKREAAAVVEVTKSKTFEAAMKRQVIVLWIKRMQSESFPSVRRIFPNWKLQR